MSTPGRQSESPEELITHQLPKPRPWGHKGRPQRASGGPECVFSISTLEALVQRGGSWHSEDAQINHLKMVPFKVPFALEFTLLHGEVSYNNPFYFFQERKGLGPATFVCLGALSRWVLHFTPAPQEDTGPSSALQGSPALTRAGSDTVQVAPVQQCASWKGPVLLQRSLSLPLASRHGSVTSRPGPASFVTQHRAQSHIFLSPIFQLSYEIIF